MFLQLMIYGFIMSLMALSEYHGAFQVFHSIPSVVFPEYTPPAKRTQSTVYFRYTSIACCDILYLFKKIEVRRLARRNRFPLIPAVHYRRFCF